MRKSGLIAFGLSCLCLVNHVWAWGSKEHIQLTRLAIEKIVADPTAPAALKEWLKSNTPDFMTMDQEKNWFMTAHIGIEQRDDLKGFSYWVIQPDVRAGQDQKDEKAKKPPTLVPPLGVAERFWHFIDMEHLNDDLDKQAYHHDLSGKPDISKASRDIHDPHYKDQTGVLPFAVEASYKELVDHLKAGKLAPPADKPTDEDNALKWAASLMHYLEDNTQPLHGTQDYKMASYFENRLKAPNVHSQVEYAMVDDEKNDYPKLRADFWEAFVKDLKTDKDPVGTNDLWFNTLQVAEINYKTIPLIGLAAMNATGELGTPDHPKTPDNLKSYGSFKNPRPFDTEKFFRFKSDVLGYPTTYMDVKAHQQAWAVIRCSEIIRKAWDEAHAK